MRRNNRDCLVSVFLLGICHVLFIFQPAFASCQKVKTENGIPVVYNPKGPVAKKGFPTQLVLRQDLLIGREAGDEGYMFSELRAVQVDDQENIYVLDWKENKIKVFDKEGKHLRTFGKKGQGPGEIQMPSRMSLTPEGKLAVLDGGNRRIAFFSPAGESLKEISTAKWSFIRVRVDSRSYIYGDNFNFGEKGLSLKLMKFDPELNPVSTITDVFAEIKPPNVNPMPDRFIYDLAKDDSLVWGFTEKYEIHFLNSEGKLTRKIIKDYDPIKVTEKDKENTIKERYGDSGAPQGVTLVFPANYAPMYSILVDDQDRIFVRTNAKDADGNYHYDVFSPDGTCYLTFSLAESEIPMAVKKDKMYCMITETEAGIPQVKRYAMEWK